MLYSVLLLGEGKGKREEERVKLFSPFFVFYICLSKN